MKLFVIGIGPGDNRYLPQQTLQALHQCDLIVGYRLYLELLADIIQNKRQQPFELGAEQKRVDFSLQSAAEGKTTALVCSGDPGIYAMASLVMQTLEQDTAGRRGKIDVEIVPGISAMQLLAARIGAPLGHDFAVISLSDLLTPWKVIEHRVRAAVDGDFVLVLYNPKSNNRGWQLGKTVEICQDKRDPSTPVAIGRNLSRANESVTLTTLGAFNEHDVDMLSIVIIGNSTSRVFDNRFYTPRGYQNNG